MSSDTVTEWKLLAALYSDQKSLMQVTEQMFTEDRLNVYRAMVNSMMKYGAVTYEGLAQTLEKVPQELFAAPTPIQPLIAEAGRLATKRALLELHSSVGALARQHNPTLADIYKILYSYKPATRSYNSGLADGAEEFLSQLYQKRSGQYTFASTGLPILDRKMGGEWRPRSLVVIAAQAGTGKTTLVANSMYNMSRMENPTNSLFFSLEMAKSDLFNKWVASILDINYTDILRGNISDEQFRAIEDVSATLQRGGNIKVIDEGKITLPEMIDEIRRHVHEYNTRVVFVDYLQMVNHHPTGSKNYDLGEVGRELKNIAKELNICVVLLSQINRQNEGINSIRDTGEVQSEADVIILMALTEDLTTGNPETAIQLDWVKNRFGPIGGSVATFNGRYQRFSSGETQT